MMVKYHLIKECRLYLYNREDCCDTACFSLLLELLGLITKSVNKPHGIEVLWRGLTFLIGQIPSIFPMFFRNLSYLISVILVDRVDKTTNSLAGSIGKKNGDRISFFNIKHCTFQFLNQRC